MNSECCPETFSVGPVIFRRNSPERRQHADEGLHKIDLRVRSRSTRPPSIPRVIVIPLQFNFAIMHDQSERLGDLLGCHKSFVHGVYRQGVEGHQSVHDAAGQ